MTDERNIKKAIDLLATGEVVAFPTETVYGLGCDATKDEACEKIYRLKNRPKFNPLIVHVPDILTACKLAHFNQDALLLSKLWPGPLTMVLPLKQPSIICKTVLCGLETVGIRVPAHPVALKLLSFLNKPIAAPSANLSGYVSASSKEHVFHDFKDQIFILEEDDAKNTYGLESTIIDLSGDAPNILRPGFITKELIEEMLNKKIDYKTGITQIKAPGMMEKHYSPHSKVRLNATRLNPNEVGLGFGSVNFNSKYSLSVSGNIIEAAQNLYSMLRELDIKTGTSSLNIIAIAPIPNEGIGVAINDRLKRAAV